MTQPSTAGAGRPSAECLRNVQLSCQLLQRHEAAFTDGFFAKVMADVRWARDLGPETARPLCDGLARSVLWVGLSQDSDTLIEKTMREVGAGYKRQGLPDDWYREFGKALLFAVRQLHPSDWGSLLSSDWVAYYMWLGEFIRLGALEVPGPEGTSTQGADTSARAAPTDYGSVFGGNPDAEARIESLGDVLAVLRARHFPDNERALGTICTRVALRTGTDLRNPRPDQYSDPLAIADVLSTLLVLGYSLQSFSIEDATAPDTEPEPGRDGNAQSTDAGVPGRPGALRRQVSRIFGLRRGTRGER